jgi:hypothetical protein
VFCAWGGRRRAAGAGSALAVSSDVELAVFWRRLADNCVRDAKGLSVNTLLWREVTRGVTHQTYCTYILLALSAASRKSQHYTKHNIHRAPSPPENIRPCRPPAHTTHQCSQNTSLKTKASPLYLHLFATNVHAVKYADCAVQSTVKVEI